MPEGHTTHAQAARLDRVFGGRTVAVSSPQGRFADAAARLDGGRFVAGEAAGKHLFMHYGGGEIVHVHLGLIGSFGVVPAPDGLEPEDVPVVGTIRLRMTGAGHLAELRGPNICALITPPERDAVLARLGPDPLRADADPEAAWARIARSGKPIAELLMDQSVLAGVGNVYRCEILHRHRVDPFRPGRELRSATWRTLWDDLRLLMPLGVAFGQILTLPDQVDAALARVEGGGVEAYTATLTGLRHGEAFERRFAVYKRTGEPCRECGSRIRTQVIAGRNLYWCGRCQRRR